MYAQFTCINITQHWGCLSSDNSEQEALDFVKQYFERNFLADDKITPNRKKQPHPLIIESIPELFRFPIHALTTQQPPMGITGLCSMTCGRGPSQFVIIGWDNFELAMEAFLVRCRGELRALHPTSKQLKDEALRKHQLLLQEQAFNPRNTGIHEHLPAVPRNLHMLFGTYALFTTATLTPPGESPHRAVTLHVGIGQRSDMMQAAVDFGVMKGTMNLAFSPLVLYEFCRMASSHPEQHTSRVPRDSENQHRKRKAHSAFNRQDHEDEKPTKSISPGPSFSAADSLMDIDIDTTTLIPKPERRVYVNFRGCCTETGNIDGNTRTGQLDFNDKFTSFDGYIEFPGPKKGDEEIWMPIRGIKTESFPERIPKMWETWSPGAAAQKAQMRDKVRAWRSASFCRYPVFG
ncbi:hypothetical protein QBC44DRAFT_367820 [Cladorrhinum sp. PSN332]|nr:hypothetical protein QBC44DRAFT_367820 [Cladorrhinum sp. PSN332]